MRPRLSLSVDFERAATGTGVVARVTGAALVSLGVAASDAERLVDGVRVALHYLTGHSTESLVYVRLDAADDGIALAASDHPGPQDGEKPPTWLRARGTDLQKPAPGRAGCDPPAERRAEPGQLLLYRTPDGHIDIGFHSPWPPARPAGPPPPARPRPRRS